MKDSLGSTSREEEEIELHTDLTGEFADFMESVSIVAVVKLLC